jgi:hypothetical protein
VVDVLLGASAASASDVTKNVGDTAKLNAANPRMEKALRRDMISVSLFSIMFNLPVEFQRLPMPAIPTSIGERRPCQLHQSLWIVRATDG